MSDINQARLFRNDYAVPPPPVYPHDIHLLTSPEDYDFNFCLAQQPVEILRTAAVDVVLEPLVVREGSDSGLRKSPC